MFIKFEIVVCKLFQFGPIRNIVVWAKVICHALQGHPTKTKRDLVKLKRGTLK